MTTQDDAPDSTRAVIHSKVVGWLPILTGVRRTPAVATTATPPWLVPSEFGTRRGLACSMTEKPSVRSRRMETVWLSCQVSHSTTIYSERSRNSTSRASSFSGDSDRKFRLAKPSVRPAVEPACRSTGMVMRLDGDRLSW